MHMIVVGFLLFFITSNIYLGYKFISTFRHLLPLPVWLIAFIWLFLALCSFIFRNEVSFLTGQVSDFFYLLGSYWIALIYYGLMLVIFCNLIAFAQDLSGIHVFRQSAQTTGLIIIGILFVLMVYGTYNASNPTVTNYTIKVAKPAKTEKMRVVLVSDIHLGKINDERLVNKIVAMANPLEPDVVLLAGDTFDSDINSVYRKNSLDNLAKIKNKYGIYASMGNHEYIQGESNAMAVYLEDKGANVLINSYAELPNGVFVYGRDDYSNSKETLKLNGINESPVIIMDHQPRRLNETENQGADLLVCGHTHKGQIFPNNFITKLMYEIDYGYKQMGNLNVIVTNGIGTWGPPLRIGNTPEIVCIDIIFEKQVEKTEWN